LTSSFIATAESKYWPSEGTLIFANGWLLPSSEVQMNIKNVSVTPTVNEKQELFELSNKIYESTLDEIVRVLNTYHTTLKSRRYWEIIVGVWLRRF
jgi:hypothetical protein